VREGRKKKDRSVFPWRCLAQQPVKKGSNPLSYPEGRKKRKRDFSPPFKGARAEEQRDHQMIKKEGAAQTTTPSNKKKGWRRALHKEEISQHTMMMKRKRRK